MTNISLISSSVSQKPERQREDFEKDLVRNKLAVLSSNSEQDLKFFV